MRAPNHLNALRAFEAAARHRSYVRAAEELHVTPAAVGQLVRSLEQALDTPLFLRSQSGTARLELTPQASLMLPDLQAGFDLLSAAVARVKSGAEHGSIALTVPPSFADKWLLARLERFQASYPQYDLLVDTNGRLVDFNSGQVDVGIRYGSGRWDGLQATRLAGDNFFPICSPALLAGEHPLRSVADLRHHALIHDVSMRGNPIYPSWRSWLAYAGVDSSAIDAERGLQINDSAAVMQAAIAGSGVALGRSMLVEKDLADGRLVRPFGPALPCEFAYYIVARADTFERPAIAAFRDWLLAEVAPA
ncbi:MULTISPECIES: transcriptional regulator GcvA [unclassified Janthinobacterium]|uniref:transcriptional regulator GcvA n=1 Tax=unclassified Janthinobacterium TaxID=2610881 RepID=UPI00161E9FBC|nr:MULTISPECIES: transcriptional regulator GcvA [unclassified Janthinobacterium]MBB5371426.1 LysR family glycine cleavage system transcriptional activator [Janthinobacterium sp. K2C7]MBB5384232.1 LysR family glycine cleavage system transcriptional activator [Janthinobacterium sp. K2Li3]MBB5389507.1 LysR family glycine cleavage system transcriptional activator [Janthinobacterium sp. K2E3]